MADEFPHHPVTPCLNCKMLVVTEYCSEECSEEMEERRESNNTLTQYGGKDDG